MRWQINQPNTQEISSDPALRAQNILNTLLNSRGLNTPELIDSFLHSPSPEFFSVETTGINPQSLQTAIDIIHQAIKDEQPILVYGDYDADGITATAILWETLHHLGAKTIPFIPSREHHGYGLSVNGLKDALALLSSSDKVSVPLIITVDNGIVAEEAATWLASQNIPLIITDHHQPKKTKPTALAIVHTENISGAGVSWILSRELDHKYSEETLDLVAIGTIADMMPLTGINRSFAKYGLQALSQSKRPGIKALLAKAAISDKESISPYHVSYVIAPRLNAMGRLEHALDSLRLLCTRNPERATALASLLDQTNRLRQDLTLDLLTLATDSIDPTLLNSIIVVNDPKYHEGIIGLIAGKLVETFYRPAIVISQKDGISKASARSIKGVNITELIREQSELLLGVGGHPMAAGFSIETEKIETFKQAIIQSANTLIDKNVFDPVLTIDTEILESDVTPELYNAIQTLEPFGIGNPQPVFALNNIEVNRLQTIGKQAEHKKIMINRQGKSPLTCLWFRPPEWVNKIKPGSKLNLAGIISQNIWRGQVSLQFILKDVNPL